MIPDGAIVCRRGKRDWTCLVEVKTGSSDLKDDQVSTYLDVARENGFDGVLTISNQITASVRESPVSLDETDDFAWPHRDGLIWPHFSSVVVGLD
ncbi:MAG: hypothetical protein ACRDV8_10165, partial [Acidimicrobiales bacterium]